MHSTRSHAFAISAVLLVCAGCATTAVTAPDNLPAKLQAPAGQAAFVEALASGVQIYDCAPKADDPAAFGWKFRAPEASLRDRSGHMLGKHYAGPTWESVDGSKVVGQLKASDAGPDPKAIPWLLLSAKSNSGIGVFATVTSVQRVRTVGGIAPADRCDASTAGQVARVPYTATYLFYRAKP